MTITTIMTKPPTTTTTAPEIVTGGRDGCVRLWDQRVNEPVLALEPGEVVVVVVVVVVFVFL